MPRCLRRGAQFLTEANFPEEKVRYDFWMLDFWRGRDIRLWAFSLISMAFAVFLLIYCVPGLNFEGSGSYSYLSNYYRAIMQTFGFILAAMFSFSIWYLGKNEKPRRNKRRRKEFINKIMSFILLCILIIMLSVIGTVVGFMPPSNLYNEVNSFPLALSIITMESTFLLTYPALSCLYEFVYLVVDYK